MFDRIPSELRAYPQWVCWRLEWRDGVTKPTKVPYSPKTGHEASVINTQHWGTFDEAVNSYGNGGNYSGIGFVLTVDDPFAFIDLDDTEGDTQLLERQKGIHDTFNSYSELSPSGKGVHIICKGHVQAGRRKHHVEVYSSLRYMTMTGNVYNDAPIQERQGYLEILWNEIGKNYDTFDTSGTEAATETNEVIFNRAQSAANGQKFLALWNGNFRDFYPSQSEADFALIDILAFYSRNRHQIRTMFLASALGARDKARRADYIERMISRSFDRQIPQLDFEGLKNNLQSRMLEHANLPVVAPQTAPTYERYDPGPELPPGLIGELAQFIYAASPRPVKDIAIMGAIGLVAAITGRAYNISGTGLNQYLLLTAKTGRGKEAMSSGIDKLITSVKLQIPAIEMFIGPGDIASGQSLIKYMANKSPSFVSIIGEFDKLLRALSHEKANSAMIMLRKAILDLYAKSGFGHTFRPMIYADEKKSTATIQSPAFSILGECTPEKFYELLSENMISEGLLPRFMVIEYLGERPPLNEDHVKAFPSESLKRKLIDVTSAAMTLQRGPDGTFRVVNIKTADDAKVLIDEFNTFCDGEINRANRDAVAELWNRAHLKVLKLAGVVAVGVNAYDPIVTRDIAAWAMRFVERDVRNLLSRFDAGEIGSDEAKQITELRRLFSDYIHSDYGRIHKYGVARDLHAAHIIPVSYLSRRLLSTAAFQHDRLGPNMALKRALGILLDQAEIVEFNKDQLQKEFGTSARAFMVKEMIV